MSIILKQETEGSIPAPSTGKGVIYVNTSGELAVKKPDGTGGQSAFAAVANSVAVANVTGIGNIALLNLTGSSTNVLYGNGVFAPAAGGGTATALNATIANVSITGGSAGYVLSTDGVGNLSWAAAGGGGGGSPGGLNTQVQYNNAGSFGGTAGFTFDSANVLLTTTNLDVPTSATIGNIYYEDNILAPIPTYVETEYGNVIVHTPLSVTAPLEILSSDTSTEAFLTLSGSQLEGYQSGGTNNAGRIDSGTEVNNVVFRFLQITDQAVVADIMTIRVGDSITCIGTNGFYTGSFTFTVTNIVEVIDYTNGTNIQILGSATSPSITGFNANILTVNRPYAESTINGGINLDYVSASEVVASEIIIDNTLVANTDAFLGAVTKPAANYDATSVNMFGGTEINPNAYRNDYFPYYFSGSTGYNFTAINPSFKYSSVNVGYRELTIEMTFQNTITFSLGSTSRVSFQLPNGTYGGYADVAYSWENNTPPTTVSAGKTIVIKYMLTFSGYNVGRLLASYKIYG